MNESINFSWGEEDGNVTKVKHYFDLFITKDHSSNPVQIEINDKNEMKKIQTIRKKQNKLKECHIKSDLHRICAHSILYSDYLESD